MAINSLSLKRNMDDIFKKFVVYIQHTLKMNQRVLRYLKTGINDDVLYEKIYKQELESNQMHQNLNDEIAWSISKEQPTSSNLRFYLAILYSLKDLERICDAAINIVNIVRSKNYPKEDLKFCYETHKLTIQVLNEIFELLLNNYRKLSHATFVKAENIQKNFHSKYLDQLFQMPKFHWLSLSKKTNFQNENIVEKISNESKFIINLTIVFKNIERCVDHALNIVESFYNIYSEKLINE